MSSVPRPGPPPSALTGLPRVVPEPDEGAAPRLRLPEHADSQAAREAVDVALRLLGVDLFERGHHSMPEGWEQRPVRGWEGEVIAPLDPAMWFKLLQSRDHPARSAFPPVHGALVRDLRRALDIRHDLYHFRIDHDVDDAVAHLHVLHRVARQLRLLCAAEIKQLKEHLQSLSPRDLSLVARPREDLERELLELRLRIEEKDAEERDLREQTERVRDDLDDARGLVALLRERGAAASESEAGSARRVQVLEQRIEELESLAAASVRAERDLSDRASLTERRLAASAPFSTAALQGLELYYAGLAGLQHLVASGAMTDAGAARSLVAHVENMILEARGLGAEGHSLAESGTASRAWVRSRFADTLDVAAGADRHGEGAESARLWRMLTRACEALLVVMDGPGWRAEPVGPRPGDPWPHVRGDQVWVLSAAQRRLLTPSGRVVERRTAQRFLRWRPEGGRVYVDVDGAASTYVDGALVFLGNVDD